MRRIIRFFNHCLWALLSLFITMIIVLGAVYAYMEIQLPNVDVLKDMHMQVPLRVYTKDGKLITQYGAKRRIPVKLKDIPKPLINAVLATEDQRYYSHPGVDLISLVRAAKAVISSGRKVQGASTITMQVARNFFLSSKKTYARKIKEILLALKIDKELSKDKVLELYLNKVYFGNRAYGVAAAARVYYGKPLNQLTLAQMAMIAGLPQAPSRNNPLRNPKISLQRRNHVLQRMYEVGYITKVQYLNAIKQPITARYHGLRSQVYAPYLAEMVRQVMVAEYGDRAYDLGLKVYTTVTAKDQTAANLALQNGLIAYSQRHGYRGPLGNLGVPNTNNIEVWQKALKQMGTDASLQPGAIIDVEQNSAQALISSGQIIKIQWNGLRWARRQLNKGYVGAWPKNAYQILKVGDVVWLTQNDDRWQLSQLPQVQGALVSINPQDGAILAIDGGFNFHDSHFNRALQAERQPGSNFKPFIYSAALNKGYTLASMINDAPVVMQDSGENQLWRPRNDTLKFYGPTRLKVGLMKSRNLVSIRLLLGIDVNYALDYVKRFGFNPKDLPHSLSLALGSGVVTPIQLAGAYTVFANGGFKVKPYFISEIVDETGKVLYQANPARACIQCVLTQNTTTTFKAPEVITPQNAYLMTRAMQSVIEEGTGRAALVLKRSDLAGKTGTTNQQMDAWFSGFNNNIETTVWVGFDSLKTLHEYGAQAALPIWVDYMRQALSTIPEATMPRPSGIVSVRIDPRNGLLAEPEQKDAVFEDFRTGYVPTQFSRLSPTSSRSTYVNDQTPSSEPLF